MKIKSILLLALVAISYQLSAISAAAQTVGLNNKLTSNEPKFWTIYGLVPLTNATQTVASPTNLPFTSAIFYGLKTVTNNAAPGINTSNAYYGFGNAICDTIPAGSWTALGGIPGQKYNLTNIVLTGATGDKVLIIYTQ